MKVEAKKDIKNKNNSQPFEEDVLDVYKIEKASTTNYYNMPNFHSHNEYEIYIQLSGIRTIITDNKLYELKKNEIIILPPSLFHKMEGNQYEKYSVNISYSLLEPEQVLLFNSIVEQVIIIPNDKVPFFVYLVDSLHDAFCVENSYSYKSKCIFSYLILFISEIAKKQFNNNPPVFCEKKVPPLLLKALDHINKNINTITFSDLSKELFASKNTLNYNFKKYLNTTVNEYIVRQKIEKVKYWLGDKSKNINKIAEICGFSSSNYLGLVFKHYEKMSPSEFRKKFYEKQKI